MQNKLKIHKKDLGNWARPQAQPNYGKNPDPFYALFYFILYIFIYILSYSFFCCENIFFTYFFIHNPINYFVFFAHNPINFTYLHACRRNTMNQEKFSKPPKACHENFFNITTCFTAYDCFL